MQAGVLVRPISKPEHYGDDAVKPAEQVRETPNNRVRVTKAAATIWVIPPILKHKWGRLMRPAPSRGSGKT